MGSQLPDQGLNPGPRALSSENSEPQPRDRRALPQTDNVDAHILQLIPSGSPALTLRDSPRGQMAALIPTGSRALMAGQQISTYKVFREFLIKRKDYKENFITSEVAKEWLQKQRGEERGSLLTTAACLSDRHWASQNEKAPIRQR